MSFKLLLEELVSNVRGAEGAIFLDAEGEAVEWYTNGNGERLRLRAAYVAVVLQAARAVASRLNAGKTNHLVLCYDGAKFIIDELESGYFLVLELNTSANIGEAQYRIQPTAAKLRREIVA